MIKLLKKLFAWLFGSKPKIEKEEPSFEQFAQKKYFSKPEPLPRKRKEPIVHKIAPDPFTIPNYSSERRRKNIQEIFIWDDEYFPARWRTKLIHH